MMEYWSNATVVTTPVALPILETSTYLDLWKLANVIPIFKKGDKQLIKNYWANILTTHLWYNLCKDHFQ